MDLAVCVPPPSLLALKSRREGTTCLGYIGMYFFHFSFSFFSSFPSSPPPPSTKLDEENTRCNILIINENLCSGTVSFPLIYPQRYAQSGAPFALHASSLVSPLLPLLPLPAPNREARDLIYHEGGKQDGPRPLLASYLSI